MNSLSPYFRSAELIDCLRCIALCLSRHLPLRALRVKPIASAQLDAAAFRLSGRGVF